ncbi:hypothetical protein D3C72_1009410 [compost metagenome]
MLGAQQRPAQAGDQRAGHHQLAQLGDQFLEFRRQFIAAREGGEDDLRREGRRQHRGQCHGQRQRAAPQPGLGQLGQAEPRGAALQQPAAQRPHGQREHQPQHRAHPLRGLPRQRQQRHHLIPQRAQPLAVFGGAMDQRRPELRVEDAVRAQRKLVAQLAAVQLGHLILQVGDVFLAVGGLLAFLVQLRLARVQFGALPRHGGGFLGGARVRWRTQHIELGLQGGALGGQRGGQLVYIGGQLAQGVVQAVELGVVRAAGGLLLDLVLRNLQALQFGHRLDVGQGDGFGCLGGRSRFGGEG